ncbi:phosphotransferase [Neobacillus mesonae]|nr:phosphotransferase [Neobacillus mesonae]
MEENLDELVGHYFDHTVYNVESVPFGLTNFTKILNIRDKKYVARMYNPHTKNTESIKLEHAITKFLSNQNLSFTVPVFIETRNSEPFVTLHDGTLASVVSFIDGKIPEITTREKAEEFGAIVGEVSLVLSQFEIDCYDYKGVSFTDIYALHPLADYQAIQSFIESPPFEVSQTGLITYKETIAFLEEQMLNILKLPKQLVHHDVLIYNLLAKDNKITGLLDFDFTSFDISFMEFAISLNHILQLTNGSWEMTEAFIKGYSGFRKSTHLEVEQLKLLTQIYHIAVLHIYIGQHYHGMNIEQNFNYILNQLQSRISWLQANRTTITQMLKSYLT